MTEPLKWLTDGPPVPDGFLVFARTAEADIRTAYEELKIRTKTHFVAVRGPTHAVLNVIGPDQLIHTLRRFWAESPDSPLLIQRMVHAMWCGKAEWQEKNLRINANEGMMILDPDTYFFSTETGTCTQTTLEPKQRRMIRYVDGTTRTIERSGERVPMTLEQLQRIATLAESAQGDITWAIDDCDVLWLISVKE
jgi:hypothetical protein